MIRYFFQCFLAHLCFTSLQFTLPHLLLIAVPLGGEKLSKREFDRFLFTVDACSRYSTMSASNLNTSKTLLAGGLAGVVSRTLVSPMERLKILFQVSPVSCDGVGWSGRCSIFHTSLTFAIVQPHHQ
jgi:hypothetical protein